MNGPNPEDSLTAALGELERLERDRVANLEQREAALERLERQASDIDVLRDRLEHERRKRARLAAVLAAEERREARMAEELAQMRKNTERARLAADVRLKRVQLELLETEQASDQRGWMALGLGAAMTALGLAIVSILNPVSPGDANTFVDQETPALRAEVEEARRDVAAARAAVSALELASAHHEAAVARLTAERAAPGPEAEADPAVSVEPRGSKTKGSKRAPSKSQRSTTTKTAHEASSSAGRPPHERIDLGSFGDAPLVGP